jgi:cell division transport system permease protein
MNKIPAHKPNYFYTIVSVTLVLFLLGLFGLLVLEGQLFIKSLKEKVEIIVELKEESTAGSVDTLQKFLAQSRFLKPNSARFISKEEGAAMMQKDFGDDFLKLDMANPLYDVLVFNVVSSWMEPDSLQVAAQNIRQFDFVNDVYYQESITDAIAYNLKKISMIVLGAGLFFIVVAVALILNTIRLALYSNRFLIKNMELVGASWRFISKPYLVRSFIHGLLCSILAIAVLTGLLWLWLKSLPEMSEMLNVPGVAIMFGALLVIGVLLNVASTYYVVKKYLKMRVDDLY